MRKVEYFTDSERQILLEEAILTGEVLIEESNLINGNFLTFGTIEEKPLFPQSEQSELEILQNQLNQSNADFMLMKLEQAQANAEIIELMMSMLGGL